MTKTPFVAEAVVRAWLETAKHDGAYRLAKRTTEIVED